jgi:hypothetical protein
MKTPYLEVTFRRGRPLAAYLYLPRSPGDKSHRTAQVELGMIIDYNQADQPIGIEITAPTRVSIADINRVLMGLNAQPLTLEDIAPLKAA